MRQIGDDLAVDGTGIPLKARTIQDALKRLEKHDRADSEPVPGSAGGARLWSAATPPSDEARNAL